MLGGSEMVAIEDAGTVAGQPRVTPGAEFVDDAGSLLGAVGNQGGGDAQFHCLEFIVDRLVGNRERCFSLSITGMDGGFDTKNHSDHHLNERGEKQLVRILLDGSSHEEIVELLGLKEMFQSGTGQYTDGTLVDEGLEIAG